MTIRTLKVAEIHWVHMTATWQLTVLTHIESSSLTTLGEFLGCEAAYVGRPRVELRGADADVLERTNTLMTKAY